MLNSTYCYVCKQYNYSKIKMNEKSMPELKIVSSGTFYKFAL